MTRCSHEAPKNVLFACELALRCRQAGIEVAAERGVNVCLNAGEDVRFSGSDEANRVKRRTRDRAGAAEARGRRCTGGVSHLDLARHGAPLDLSDVADRRHDAGTASAALTKAAFIAVIGGVWPRIWLKYGTLCAVS
jgi:hypothetical protein